MELRLAYSSVVFVNADFLNVFVMFLTFKILEPYDLRALMKAIIGMGAEHQKHFTQPWHKRGSMWLVECGSASVYMIFVTCGAGVKYFQQV